jgi:RecA/RadA recombinase
LNCQLSIEDGGIDGACAYLSCGEGEFPIRRLSQLATFYQKKSSVPISHSKFLEQIHIEKCYCSNDAIETISSKLPLMCQTQGVKLLVIDSLAGFLKSLKNYSYMVYLLVTPVFIGLVRTEFDVKDKNEIIDRTKFLFRLAQSLKWLADTFKICIIVLNQVFKILTCFIIIATLNL